MIIPLLGLAAILLIGVLLVLIFRNKKMEEPRHEKPNLDITEKGDDRPSRDPRI
ncbi:MAG: hypothetical protein M3Q97_05350 [Bacteroidota bacterium]|nr:hypothetical protein [Bacteroidota bacterium]